MNSTQFSAFLGSIYSLHQFVLLFYLQRNGRGIVHYSLISELVLLYVFAVSHMQTEARVSSYNAFIVTNLLSTKSYKLSESVIMLGKQLCFRQSLCESNKHALISNTNGSVSAARRQ